MTRSVCVIGAGGAVGEAAASRLAAEGWRVRASMRTPRPDVAARLRQQGIEVAQHDLSRDSAWAAYAEPCEAVIFCTHLKLTVAALAATRLSARIVAFSSNNLAIHPEAAAYRELAAAEAALRARHPAAAIIRPTLIYGDPRLPTLSRVLRMAKAWPLIPLPGSGEARVQPVFCGDLGALAAGLAQTDAPGLYAAGGPDIVTMRELFAMALRVTGGRGLIAPIPAPLLSVAAPLLSALKLFSADQARRADQDRLAVPQTPLPAQLAPRTDLVTGLTQHWAALRAAAK